MVIKEKISAITVHCLEIKGKVIYKNISQSIRVQTSGPIACPSHSQLEIRLPIVLRVKIF